MFSKIFAFVSLIVIAAVSRFIPHAPNFTPFLAIALFAGAKSPSKWVGFVAPVLALWLTDLVIGVHHLMLVTGGAMIVSTFIGMYADRISKNAFASWGISGFLASAFFFLSTNFALWYSTDMYPHTSAGLWTCFVMALPFFQNQLLATWLYSGALVAVWNIAESRLAVSRA